jgi:hypothetical protein
MMTDTRPLLFAGAAALIGMGIAFAQAPLFDPQQLPTYKGQVQLFTLTPRGDIDGMILADGTEVKTPPHLSTQIAFAVKLGDAVTIHGLKAAALPLVQAMSVTDDATGKSVVDNGPPGPGRDAGPPPPPPPGAAGPGAGAPPPPAPGEAASGPATSGTTEVAGRVRMALHGPRGDVNGVLLEDGTILRLPPPEAARLSALMQPGQTLVAQGVAEANPIGKVLGVQRIGPTKDQLSPVGPPPHGKPGRHGPPPV